MLRCTAMLRCPAMLGCPAMPIMQQQVDLVQSAGQQHFKLKNSDEIGVRCGCFYGTLKEFKEKVKETHGESKKAKEYLMLADLMEYRFSEEKKA